MRKKTAAALVRMHGGPAAGLSCGSAVPVDGTALPDKSERIGLKR